MAGQQLDQGGGIDTRKRSENSGIDFHVLHAQPECFSRSQRHWLVRNLICGQQRQQEWVSGWTPLISLHCRDGSCTDALQISLTRDPHQPACIRFSPN